MEPGRSYPNCISCHPEKDSISLSRAREQHAVYCRALGDLGLEVIKLPTDDSHPDSCFVEDNAVVHSGRALICRMARETRRGEEGPVEEALSEYLRTTRAVDPATVEGGDVIHLPDKLISGLSERTNSQGVEQMHNWLNVHVDTVEDPNMVHLKSYATYLGEGKMVVSKRFAEHPVLGGFELIVLPDSEAYAADTLTVNGTVLMASGREKARALVRDAGFEVISMDTSEYEKCQGALTCLSILF
ncbi:MAG: hypothetical protein A3K60_08655 [Euryarchaeota archaeon RBG_19FT_COMBO_56_21]|nr:MAG: hypothetical protein A3K60_08655 [Euryarchaeota archaeon RBG_19FT_COMBO_56_21]